MAHCEEYLDLISAAIDGALSPAQREALDAHLDRCPECRALYTQLSTLHAALGELPPIEPPEGLTERIMDAVAAEKVIPLSPKRSPVHWQRWLASAAVLALVLLGTWSWKPWLRKAAAPTSPLNGAGTSGAAVADAAVPEVASELAPSPDAAAPQLAEPDPHQSAQGMAGGLDAAAPQGKMAPAADDPGAPENSQDNQFASQEGSREADPRESGPETPAAAQEGSQEATPQENDPAAPQEGSQAPVAPRMALSAIPAPKEDGGIAPPALFSTNAAGDQLPTLQPVQTDSSPEEGTLTPQKALERLSEICPMPEDGIPVDTADRLGWETPLVPVGEDPSPNAQQVSTRLEYLGLSGNGRYHEFWLYSFLLDDPAQGLAHSSTLNFFAVPLEEGEILRAYGDYEDLSDPAAWEAYQAGLTAYQEAISN